MSNEEERPSWTANCPICDYPHDADSEKQADALVAAWHRRFAAERKPYVVALRALVEAIGDQPPTRDTVKRGSFCALTDKQHARIAEARAILDAEAARET